MTILVTGATGNVGRPLIDHLLDAGADVRAVTRNPSAAALPAAVRVVTSPFDGLHDATAVFVNSRALGDQMAALVAAAARSGVRRLVALSAINAADDDSRQPSRFRGDRNREADQLAAGSGLPWVSLRPTLFASNFVGMWAAQIRRGDTVYGPYARASLAPVADIDIGAVAAHALLDDDLAGHRIELTGPKALTNAELAGVIGTVLDRPIRYQEVSTHAVRDRFAEMGFPAGFADAYVAMLAHALERPAVVTPDVEKILGRPATSFAEWAATHRADFTSGR
jgi:uncharacterized protein YbjT (DUF2867 family)